MQITLGHLTHTQMLDALQQIDGVGGPMVGAHLNERPDGGGLEVVSDPRRLQNGLSVDGLTDAVV